ncbi:2278_t:CDS:1, partial [Ambispora leptoticha]
ICDGLRPKISYAIPKSWKDLIEECWNENPKKRPNANQLGKQLKKIRRRGAKWIEKDIDESETGEVKTEVKRQSLHPDAIYTSRLIPYLSNTSTIHNDDLFTPS